MHPAPGAEIVCILAPLSRGTCGFDMATASSTLCGKPGKRGLQWQGNVLSEFYKMLNDRERWADLSDPRHNDDQTTSSPEEVVRTRGGKREGRRQRAVQGRLDEGTMNIASIPATRSMAMGQSKVVAGGEQYSMSDRDRKAIEADPVQHEVPLRARTQPRHVQSKRNALEGRPTKPSRLRTRPTSEELRNGAGLRVSLLPARRSDSRSRSPDLRSIKHSSDYDGDLMEYEKSLDDIKEEEWKSKRSLKHGQNRGAKLMGLSALMNILGESEAELQARKGVSRSRCH